MKNKLKPFLILISFIILLALVIILANGNDYIEQSYIVIESGLMMFLGLSFILLKFNSKQNIIKLGLGKTRKNIKKDAIISSFISIIMHLILFSLIIIIDYLVYKDTFYSLKDTIIYLGLSYIIACLISLIMTLFAKKE